MTANDWIQNKQTNISKDFFGIFPFEAQCSPFNLDECEEKEIALQIITYLDKAYQYLNDISPIKRTKPGIIFCRDGQLQRILGAEDANNPASYDPIMDAIYIDYDYFVDRAAGNTLYHLDIANIIFEEYLHFFTTIEEKQDELIKFRTIFIENHRYESEETTISKGKELVSGNIWSIELGEEYPKEIQQGDAMKLMPIESYKTEGLTVILSSIIFLDFCKALGIDLRGIESRIHFFVMKLVAVQAGAIVYTNKPSFQYTKFISNLERAFNLDHQDIFRKLLLDIVNLNSEELSKVMNLLRSTRREDLILFANAIEDFSRDIPLLSTGIGLTSRLKGITKEHRDHLPTKAIADLIYGSTSNSEG